MSMALFSTFLLAALISGATIPGIIDFARKRNLLELNDARKKHLERVSSLGGIGIFAAFWLAAFVVMEDGFFAYGRYLFVASFILFLTSIQDDLVGLSPLKRLLIQVVVSTSLYFLGWQITSIPGLGLELHPIFSYLLTCGFIIAMINAYNFIDGVNGLAGGLACISALALVWLFQKTGHLEFALLAIGLAGAFAGFLLFNFRKRARIFMGDNGSTFIGLMLAVLIIRFTSVDYEGVFDGFSVLLLLGILSGIPLVDLAKVVVMRMLRGQSPMQPDRTHIHHHLLNLLGSSHRKVCLVLFSWTSLFFLLAILIQPEKWWTALICLSLFPGGIYMIIHLLSARRKLQRIPKSHPSLDSKPNVSGP